VAKVFAARLSLITFTAVVIDSLISGMAFRDGIGSAMSTGAIAFGLGLIVGELARRIIEENAEAEFDLKDAPPIPTTVDS